MLEPWEQLWVRSIQIDLRAVKTCEVCDKRRPVSSFKAYGVNTCNTCADTRSLDEWWAAQKARLAA